MTTTQKKSGVRDEYDNKNGWHLLFFQIIFCSLEKKIVQNNPNFVNLSPPSGYFFFKEDAF